MRTHCLLFILSLWAGFATDLSGQIKLPSLKSVLGKPDKPVVSDTSDLGKVLQYLEERSPVSTNFDNAIYESEVMADFEPAPDQYLPLELQPTAEKGGFKLRSGLYTMMAKSFCLKAGTYGPSRGDGHLYAPLAGRKREMVETILERYAKHPEIPQQKIQVLLWAIIARADVANLLKSEHFISLKKLFTLPELAKMLVVDIANQEIDNKINALDSKMPPIVKKALHAEREIQNLITSNPIYERLEQVAVLAGIAPAQDMIREVSRGRWSYHPDGYFVRFFPQGYQRTRVDVYVPNTGNLQLDASGNQVLSHNARAQGESKEVVFNPAKMVAVPANRSSQRIGVSPVPEDACQSFSKITKERRIDHWKKSADKLIQVNTQPEIFNEAITCAYANMYSSNPEKYKWAGMASIVSGIIGRDISTEMDPVLGLVNIVKGVNDYVFGKKNILLDYTVNEANAFRNSLVKGNRAVFEDLYWQHLAFKEGGIDEMKKLYCEGSISATIYSAWEKIHRGEVWEGNLALLQYEQSIVIQPILYDNHRIKWWFIDSYVPSLILGDRLKSPVPGDDSIFPGENIAAFGQRWDWIEKNIWPSWKKYQENRTNQEQLKEVLRKHCPSCCQ